MEYVSEKELLGGIEYWDEDMGYASLAKALLFLMSSKVKKSFIHKYGRKSRIKETEKQMRGLFSCIEICAILGITRGKLSYILYKNEMKGKHNGTFRMYTKENVAFIKSVLDNDKKHCKKKTQKN